MVHACTFPKALPAHKTHPLSTWLRYSLPRVLVLCGICEHSNETTCTHPFPGTTNALPPPPSYPGYDPYNPYHQHHAAAAAAAAAYAHGGAYGVPPGAVGAEQGRMPVQPDDLPPGVCVCVLGGG